MPHYLETFAPEPPPVTCLCGREVPCDRTPACNNGHLEADLTPATYCPPDGLLNDLAGMGVYLDATGSRVRVTSQLTGSLLGWESVSTFSISMSTRDLIRLLGLMRAPVPWLRCDVGGYVTDALNRIVEVDSLVATWDRCDERVELIAGSWGWRSAPDPSPGDCFLAYLEPEDIHRISAIRRYWAAGIRPADLAPRYLDAGISVGEARLLQRRPEEWSDLRSMVNALTGLRNPTA